MMFNINQCRNSIKCNVSNKFCILLFLILNFIKNINAIGYHFERMDLETCLGQFDVHHDTIIRTEESQAIGGKYLQGIGLNNLEECQRLCCETEHCDVYIFEEKAEGYCYLFECGPPENFHCKFTRHANYTSAVLTPPIRHATSPPSTPKPSISIHPPILPQIPPAASLSQHEIELTNLKQNNHQQSKTFTTTIPPFGVAVEAGRGINGRLAEQITTSKSPQMNASVCGRFQFQCHSGECIAVYNACDGIPQCDDGSDEGPECPTTTGGDSKSINAETNKLSEISNYKVSSGNAAVALSKQTMQIMPRQFQQPPIQNLIINNREDPMSAPSIWQNRKTQDSQADLETNSHIFNHKGGLHYANPAPNIYNPIQRDMYMQADIQNAYQNPIIQPQDHMIPPPNINWQQAPQIQQPGPYVIAVNGQAVPQIKSVSPALTQPQLNDVQIKTNPDAKSNHQHLTSSESNDNKKIIENHKGHDKEKVSVEEAEDYSYYEDKSTEPPKKKQRKHKKISSKDKEKNKTKKEEDKDEKESSKGEKLIDAPVRERYKMIKEDLEMEFVDHDGQSERPGGAVLSLTLGLIVTAALAILIGCRMRTVGRRVRRIGKTPYAHDADFLVNGMYL